MAADVGEQGLARRVIKNLVECFVQLVGAECPINQAPDKDANLSPLECIERLFC